MTLENYYNTKSLFYFLGASSSSLNTWTELPANSTHTCALTHTHTPPHGFLLVFSYPIVWIDHKKYGSKNSSWGKYNKQNSHQKIGSVPLEASVTSPFQASISSAIAGKSWRLFLGKNLPGVTIHDTIVAVNWVALAHLNPFYSFYCFFGFSYLATGNESLLTPMHVTYLSCHLPVPLQVQLGNKDFYS